ncbi:MAG: hypothetical protein JJT78_04860 [Leptospira sp.]|nr:hypothetical protein [Leptospira sp.]
MISYIVAGSIIVICLLLFIFSFITILEIYGMLRKFDKLYTKGLSLKDGQSSIIRGRIVAENEILKSPITGEDCVAYEAYVSEQIRRGYPNKLLEETKTVPFKIITHHGDLHFENKEYPNGKSASEDMISFEFPFLDIYKQNLKNLSPDIISSLTKLGVNFNNRSNNIMDSAVHITQSSVPHDKEVFVLGKFNNENNGILLDVKACPTLNSIVISDSLDGIKKSLKTTKLFNYTLMFISFISPFALVYLILL